jgi:hypothetical protein
LQSLNHPIYFYFKFHPELADKKVDDADVSTKGRRKNCPLAACGIIQTLIVEK